MTITNAFRELFYSAYSGENKDADYKIALERYFPEDISQHKITTYRDLKKPKSRSSTAFDNAIINHLTPHLLELAKNENPNKEFLAFKQEIEKTYQQISQFGNFLSLSDLIYTSGANRSLAGIFELGDYCGITRDFHVVFVNDYGFIVPDYVTTNQLSKCLKSARGAAKYFGSIYPFDQLGALPDWDLVPREHVIRLAKELISIDDMLLTFGNDYFGICSAKGNTILTQLIKIYSVYEETIDEHLEASFKRTLKKKITGNPSSKLKEKVNRLEILNACSVYFIDYCLQMKWCESDGNYISASQNLRTLIKENPPENKEPKKFYEIEKKLVEALRKNGKPMHTFEFIPAMEDAKANKSHEEEFPFLFYRRGAQYNSTYHTLDDQYESKTGEIENVHQVDRTRIEINRINRKESLARKTKQVCEYICQLCGDRIEIGEDEFYAEAHHIKPLGIPHNGDDFQENMICVCPNCHVKLDYGVIHLDKSKLHNLDKNPIGDMYITYHNQNIYNGKKC
jgi:hypothetical protein